MRKIKRRLGFLILAITMAFVSVPVTTIEAKKVPEFYMGWAQTSKMFLADLNNYTWGYAIGEYDGEDDSLCYFEMPISPNMDGTEEVPEPYEDFAPSAYAVYFGKPGDTLKVIPPDPFGTMSSTDRWLFGIEKEHVVDGTVVFKSSNPSIASVDKNGKVKLKKNGHCEIHSYIKKVKDPWTRKPAKEAKLVGSITIFVGQIITLNGKNAKSAAKKFLSYVENTTDSITIRIPENVGTDVAEKRIKEFGAEMNKIMIERFDRGERSGWIGGWVGRSFPSANWSYLRYQNGYWLWESWRTKFDYKRVHCPSCSRHWDEWQRKNGWNIAPYEIGTYDPETGELYR